MAAKLGLVVYNLRDFHSSGGLISTNLNRNSTIKSGATLEEFEAYKLARINIFNDIVVPYAGDNGYFTKLGILAHPGTKFVLNENKTIMIGRTGVYELDEDIQITSLYFVHPRLYVTDLGATLLILLEGMHNLNEAKNFLVNELEKLDNKYGLDTSQAYWNEYIDILSKYFIQYNNAIAQYNLGVNGIYVLPSYLLPIDDPLYKKEDYEGNFTEVYDVIIDFIY